MAVAVRGTRRPLSWLSTINNGSPSLFLPLVKAVYPRQGTVDVGAGRESARQRNQALELLGDDFDRAAGALQAAAGKQDRATPRRLTGG